MWLRGFSFERVDVGGSEEGMEELGAATDMMSHLPLVVRIDVVGMGMRKRFCALGMQASTSQRLKLA